MSSIILYWSAFSSELGKFGLPVSGHYGSVTDGLGPRHIDVADMLIMISTVLAINSPRNDPTRTHG